MEGFKGWIQGIWLPYTQRVPEHLRDTFVDAIAMKYLENHPACSDVDIRVKMVRLEVEAKK
jgi:hypothetical protein